MSDAASTSLQRVVSDRHFLGRSLVTTTVAAVISAVALIAIVLCSGGIVELLSRNAQGSDVGLLQADPETAATTIQRIVDAIPLLHSRMSALTTLIFAIVVLLFLRTALRAFAQEKVNRQVSKGVNRLREHIQRHALRSNPGDLTGKQRRIAASLFQTTAQQLQDNAQRWAFTRLTTFCDLIALAALLIATQWRISLECVIPIIVGWWVARIETKRHQASANLLSEQVDRGLQRLTEDLGKARIVAGYGMENLEHEQFKANLSGYQSKHEDLRRQQLYGGWTSLLIMITTIALPCFILTRHLLARPAVIELSTGVMIAIGVALVKLCLKRWECVPTSHGASTVAAEEINQYLLRVPPVSQVVGARFLEPMSRSLQLNQVSVETESNPELLSGLDLKIEAGQKVALLSLNSAEAEALISLIPRFSDPTRGQVLIDGQDIKRVTLESLRAEAVIVGGNEPVFNTTVLENITAGQADISRQDAIEACKTAHAETFIRQLSKGYETHLGDNFAKLDVGQVFRLSLARAIAKKPALLVIQEPDAMLDTETKAMIDDTYQRICQGRTVIFLPSRLSTVKRCDRVVMLHNGRVAADGRHEDLVRKTELYRHWEYMRFNVFRSDG
ncbi:MAG: ABC transporter ATP-binding protein [Fuerstiella sp.]